MVDIQYDFLETGTLPVPEASAILPNVQQLITFAESYQGLIVATQVSLQKEMQMIRTDSISLTFLIGLASKQSYKFCCEPCRQATV